MHTLFDRIEINPGIMLGKPVIRGTRITVEMILNKLAQNVSTASILRDYPRLTEDDIKAALVFASQSLSTDEVVVLAGDKA